MPAQPFKGGQLAAQRNCLILGCLTRSSLGSSREAGYRGQTQVIDFQCCIFAPLKGCLKPVKSLAAGQACILCPSNIQHIVIDQTVTTINQPSVRCA